MGRMGVSVGRLKCCTGYFIMIFLICCSWKNIRIQCYSPINPHLPKDQSDSWPGRGAWSQHVELPTGQITPSSLLYLQTLQVWFHCWWWQSYEPFGHLYVCLHQPRPVIYQTKVDINKTLQKGYISAGPNIRRVHLSVFISSEPTLVSYAQP